ncbi:WD40/YVTN repeat-like-containing domain,WD40 repeat, conserved site,WD40 repeat,WD40-repeat-containing [Cinara cedri]|uniref:methylated diphthine methylhydrolase n=1 Tax=Cinara cedri TaxID=506608 RepID=A0A5E4MZC2_9HEMI|nr:WD40/YVTN repeat-like-containing domain,WD40 repeat, conserved site,WD40 repeat,WD40-repeat-containing [Cinara cedri]
MSAKPSVDLYVSYDTIYPADTVEWCPISEYKDVFVCGTYKLDETNKLKTGTINLFILEHKNKIKLIQSIHGDAVLDLKWNFCIVSGKILLAAALSGKHISVYSLDKEENDLCLNMYTSFNLPKTDDESHMSLSIAWSSPDENGTQSIAFSDSRGYITVVNLNDCLVRNFKAHNFESWIVTFHYGEPNILYTGGDDCKFKCYDQRLKFDKPVFENKEHKQGVTTCSSSKIRKNIIATGSYDEIVRLWDVRNMKQSYNNVNVNGGVWRLKWEPINEDYILSASMFNAAHIIDTSLNICHSFGEKNNRLFYGADWCHLNENKKIISTCSFYDHKLDLFVVNMKL